MSEYLKTNLLAISQSFTGIILATLSGVSYVKLRRSVKSNSVDRNTDYSAGSRVLHNLALGTPFVGEALFDLEKAIHGTKSPHVTDEHHVFVAGLARAGTTVLMRKLYESNRFRSLTYRDMPFILAPNIWKSLSSIYSKDKQSQERAHGDRLLVDFDSPEAFEEVFWKLKCSDIYIGKNHLQPMTADPEQLDEFRQFVSLVIKGQEKKRYLSKNNNNILRLQSISDAFPQATILIPFRRPLQQAFSLMRQHQRFCEMHKNDGFSKKYMTWLVHHEFGSGHRPFVFEGEPSASGDPTDLCYWVQLWISSYNYILKSKPPNGVLVCYEQLCSSDNTWEELATLLHIQGASEMQFVAQDPSEEALKLISSVPGELTTSALKLYRELEKLSVGIR